jgi:opacity protein-like surface antigen
MKVNVSGLIFAIVALAGASSPGVAGGDWDAAGIASYNRSVPVPAPIPVPVNRAQWYLRGDVSWTASAGGDIDVTGYPVDTFDFAGGDGPWRIGFGVGYYITRNLRIEGVIEYKEEQTTTRHTESITQTLNSVESFSGNVGGVPTTANALYSRDYTGDFDHESTIKGGNFLLNLIYDFDTGTRFQPFIGVGAGVAVHRLHISGDSVLYCDDETISDLGTDFDETTPILFNPACTGGPASIDSRDSNAQTAYGFAGALMAGFSYEIDEGIMIDTGYRFLYEGGKAVIGFHTPATVGTIEVGERTNHEIRTGIRFDLF